ncbi:ABC transporter ATP-binding protein [Kribbella sp. NPDC056861]|uniref:ABC transporter ATP-binding protein n=1 Tax=Kribbella sp. NPDC056861 TaxID=3154857 RepID=UPI003439D4D1
MIRQLRKVLDDGQRALLRTYLCWLVSAAVLEGAAMVLLVPTLRSLLTDDLTQALRWTAALAVATIVTCVARYQHALRGFRLALITLETLHQRLGDRIATLPLGWFGTEKVGRLARSATSGTMTVTNVFAHQLGPVVGGIVTPATVAAGMFLFDWRLGLAIAVVVPVLVLAHRWSSAAIGRTDREREAADTLAANRVVEFARTQQTLRAFGRAQGAYPPLEAAIESRRLAARRVLAVTMPRLMAGGLAVQLAFAVLVGVGLVLLLSDSADAVTLVALLALAARFVGPLTEAAARSGGLRMAGNDLARVVEVLDEPSLPEPEVSVGTRTPGQIQFDQVTFGYGDRSVLAGLDLVVPAGTMTAVVGASGAGKTTLARLVMRFFDVSSGAVRVGGADVRELTTRDLMAQVSLVAQDVYLFDDTLEANIRIGRPEATMAEVHEAARIAGLDEVVARLPQGWDTPVGEGGSSLSGGERQRVSIARAVLKNAPIVILDEATAALDATTERHVRQALHSLRGNSTLLVIAHQLSTIVEADQIVVLADGAITELGTHDELLVANGRYARFWNERNRSRGWRLAGSTVPA